MACMNPVPLHYNIVTHKYQYIYDKDCDPLKSIHVNCGRCPSCAAKWRTQLAQRALMEYNKYGYNKTCFLTLTINNEHMEECCGNDMSLNHRPVQLFMKRLRAKLKYYGIDVKIKYLCCGEYGAKNGRPHWHMIIYGWKPTDLVFKYNSRSNMPQYKSQLVEECWGYGYVDIGDVTENSAPYLAKYIAKNKEIRRDEYVNFDGVIVKKPYLVYPHEMLGVDFFKENYVNILRLGYLISSNGKKVSIPRCFLKLAESYPKMKKEFDAYRQRLKEYFEEVNDELEELGYCTPSERFAYALDKGLIYRENYNAYELNVKNRKVV